MQNCDVQLVFSRAKDSPFLIDKYYRTKTTRRECLNCLKLLTSVIRHRCILIRICHVYSPCYPRLVITFTRSHQILKQSRGIVKITFPRGRFFESSFKDYMKMTYRRSIMWEAAVPHKAPDNLVSSKYTTAKVFVPSYEKYGYLLCLKNGKRSPKKENS